MSLKLIGVVVLDKLLAFRDKIAKFNVKCTILSKKIEFIAICSIIKVYNSLFICIVVYILCNVCNSKKLCSSIFLPMI